MRFLGMHPTQEEISNIINEYDLDGDGHIDFSEYKQIYIAYVLPHPAADRFLQKEKSRRPSGSSIETERAT
jgi:hypothetical protein